MLTFLFKLAAIVMFVFTLIASLKAGSFWLGESWLVWGSSGFLAAFFAMFFAPYLDTQLQAARTYRRPVVAEDGAHNA